MAGHVFDRVVCRRLELACLENCNDAHEKDLRDLNWLYCANGSAFGRRSGWVGRVELGLV